MNGTLLSNFQSLFLEQTRITYLGIQDLTLQKKNGFMKNNGL